MDTRIFMIIFRIYVFISSSSSERGKRQGAFTSMNIRTYIIDNPLTASGARSESYVIEMLTSPSATARGVSIRMTECLSASGWIITVDPLIHLQHESRAVSSLTE